MRHPRQYRILPKAGVELLTASYRAQRFVPHTHDYAVLATTESGEAIGSGPSGIDHFLAGCVLLIPPNVVHAAQVLGSSPWEYRALYLSRQQYETIAAPALRPGVAATSVVHRDPLLAKRVREMHHDLEAAGDCDGALSALAGLMTELAPVVERAHAPRRIARHATTDAVARAKAMIDAEPERRWSLPELATACAVSPFHLCRAFTGQLGASPYAYALQRRVDSARAMLRTNRTISSVAHDLCFADHSHFTRAFVQVFGMSPNEYRAAVRRNAG
ncbi:MAG: AraC family transcriptional regulator [Gemmatimonadaceae bacterium]|nr:AraC family transcriptional regulator [Gemmatimonadaceae bacterium]